VQVSVPAADTGGEASSSSQTAHGAASSGGAGLRVKREDITPLGVTEDTLRGRKEGQQRYNVEKVLEPTWGYGRFGLYTWNAAVDHGLTSFYMRHRSELGSVQLKHFLEYCQNVRDARAAGAATAETGSGTAEGGLGADRAEVVATLTAAKDSELVERRRVFKNLLLKWHPDKNPGREGYCGVMFQHVVAQKAWFVTYEKAT